MMNTLALQRTLGERLVKVRHMAGGLTQQQMADRLGVGKRSLCRYEKGEALPDVEMLVKVREEFPGVTVAWLMGEAEGEGITGVVIDGEDQMAPVYMMSSLFSADDFLIAA